MNSHCESHSNYVWFAHYIQQSLQRYSNVEVSIDCSYVSHSLEGLNAQLLTKYSVSYKVWCFEIRFNSILHKRSVYFTVKHSNYPFRCVIMVPISLFMSVLPFVCCSFVRRYRQGSYCKIGIEKFHESC